MFDFNDSTFIADQVFISDVDSTQKNSYSRILIRDMEDNDFILEIESTNDNGATWRSRDKLSYVRRERK